MTSAPSTRAPNLASCALALVAGTLVSCGYTPTQDDFSAARQSWRGATYDDVLKQWGAPSQSSVESHTWLSDDRIQQSGGGGMGGVLFAPARCDRTLAFRDGRVVDERWAGDPAFCTQFARKR